jgi:hypothetical protein
MAGRRALAAQHESSLTMATLLLTAVGTLLGGPIGGAIGALAGQQLDLAVIGSATREGPRLKELSVQTSSYGAPLPRHYGRMRAAGSVIWATELKESRDKSGGGKGKPKVVTYSYSASFAVALASRPIQGIGRIWADGNLLRGAAGDLKVGGTLRIHTGHHDQAVDPLIAAAEGAATCPAFRGIAYLVLEDLALADFGNRIPSLTVEVFADDGSVPLAWVLADALPETHVADISQTLAGYSIDGGTGADLLEGLAEIIALTCISDGSRLLVRGAEGLAGPDTALPEPLLVDASAARRADLTLRQEPLPERRAIALCYYEVERDYQPGVQRARGRSHAGEPATIEFPAALETPTAAALANAIASHRESGRDTAKGRIADAGSAYAPGRVVVLPGKPGRWLIESWELGGSGIELGLRRLRMSPVAATDASDPGRANLPPDLLPQPTILAAFELPWDGVGNPGDARLFAAASAAGAGWTGAALFVERDGNLSPIGGTGRARATLGLAETALGPAPAAVLDHANALVVALAAPDLALASASLAQLAAGANRALLGEELLQFAQAEPLGSGRWRLSGLLRGRGGTEWAIAGHAAGDRFVLIDDSLVSIDPAVVGDPAHARIGAQGLADQAPVIAAIALPGSSLLPLSPVHGALLEGSDGSVSLRWVRRARGAWLWRDGIDAPLVEQSESYLVTLGLSEGPIAQWITGEPALALDPGTVAALRAQSPGAPFAVRQRGDHGLSPPFPLGLLP